MQPKISIIIPVYNMERYLRQCLDSCRTQTMCEIQIICVDDGSTDASPEILAEYANNDARMIVATQKNGGQAAARNTALPLVRGKYLIFVDSDDWIHAETCQRTFQLAEKNDADLCIFSSARPGIKSEKTKRGHNPHDNVRFFSDLTIKDKCREKLLTRNVSAWGKLIRTDFLRQHGFTFPQGLVFEDMPFHWNVIRSAGQILLTDDVLYYYRQRPGSTMTSRGRHHFDIIAIYDIIRNDLEKSGCYDDCRQPFIKDKLAVYRNHYREISPRLRPEMRQRILESLTGGEWEFLLNDPTMNQRHRRFYQELKRGFFSLQNIGWLAFAEFWRACEYHVLWPSRSLWEFNRFTKKVS